MKTVSDFMTPQPLTVSSATRLGDAAKVLITNGISSVPVFDNLGESLGLLSEFALIRCILKQSQSDDRSKDQIYHFKEFLEPVGTISAGASVQDTIKMVFAHSSHRVLVQNNSAKVVGIVSPRDILKVLNNDEGTLSKLEEELEQAREQLRKVAGKLKDSEEILVRYHSYLEDAPFSIHSINDEGRVIFANKRLLQALGYTAGEMIGMTLEEVYTPDQIEKARAGLSNIMNNGVHEPVITTMRCKDGSVYRVEAISSSLTSPDGKFVATVTISRRMAADNMLRALNGVLDVGKATAFE